MRVAIGFSEDVPLARQQDVARRVEQAGFASLWTNEARGRDALLVCQAWAAATTRLRVGVGVVPLWSRSAAQLAMGAATLQEASSGRFLLGIGVSHPATMTTWHGADYRAPLVAARETLEVVRTLLAGAESDHAGAVVTSRRFRLALDPLPPAVPLYLAALGPRMLALAGRHADGVLLNWSSPDTVAQAAAAVRDAAAAAGRPAPTVAAYVRVAVAEDRAAARSALAGQVAGYCALDAYADHFRRQGFAAEVAAVREGYRRGGGEAAGAAVPDEMLDALGWSGGPGDDPSPLAAHGRSGVDELIARVVVVGDDPVASVEAAGAALAPLTHGDAGGS